MTRPLTPERQLDLFGAPAPGASAIPEEPQAQLPDAPPPAGPAHVRIVEIVDRLLLEHGEVRLTSCAALLFAETPRTSGDPLANLLPALRQVVAYGRAQGLVVFDGSRGVEVALDPDAPPLLRAIEARTWILKPSATEEQTDIFRDGAQTVALNVLRRAILDSRSDEVPKLLAHARAAGVIDLEDYAALAGFMADDGLPEPAAAGLAALRERARPIARRTLGSAAHAFLAPLWSRLARRLEGATFRTDDPDLHASYAWFQAKNWDESARSIVAVEDWESQPALVIRLAQSEHHRRNAGAARRAWARLFWSHPGVAEESFGDACADPSMVEAWSRFLDAEIGFETRDFPAWLLIVHVEQRERVPPDIAPPDECGRAFVALHRLIAGGGAMEDRKALHALRPMLLKAWLAGRR